MVLTEDAAGPSTDGFEGDVAGLGLTDVLQLNAQNRFTGCLRVRHGDSLGVIFFRDGDVVHAERGDRTGEEAVRDILAWPGGRFSVEPKVVAAHRTIHKRCEHLLLDAQRAFDERRAGRPEANMDAPEPAPPPRPGGPSAALQTVRRVPGVREAVLLTRDGRAVGDEGPASETLAGQALFLALAAAELGTFFRIGEVRSANAEGSKRHLVLLATRSHYLGVFADASAQVGAVESAIRAALTPAK